MEPHAAAPSVALELILFLAATSLVVPALKRARLSAIMGFILIGVLLGPHGLGRLAGVLPWFADARITETEQTHWLAELGVVFLLFAIGLEVSVERLKALRRWVFGLGIAQVAVTAVAIGLAALAFGNAFPVAVVVGLALALSSTAVVLQLLAQRRALSSAVGRAGFSVLLLQDIAVVPILAVVGAMGAGAAAQGGADAGRALAVAALAVTGILIAGRFLARPLFRFAASVDSREVFVAAALLVVVGAAYAAQAAGVSAALGAFLAGMVLAGTEFRHQIEIDVEPFKGLLLGLFFVTVGMQIDVALLMAEPLRVVIGVVGLFIVKAAIIAPLARALGLRWPQAIELSLLLAQAGEFGFVVIALAQDGRLIPTETADYMLLVVALSLFLTPLVATLGSRLAAKLSPVPVAAPPEEKPQGHVLIAGFGRVGQGLAELLAEQDIPHVAVESDAERVAQAKRHGWPVYFGDAARRDVLEGLGAKEAAAIVVTLNQFEDVERIVAEVRTALPDVPVFARARDSAQARRLHDLGAALASAETVESSLQLGEALLRGIGLPDEAARRIIAERREREAARALG